MRLSVPPPLPLPHEGEAERLTQLQKKQSRSNLFTMHHSQFVDESFVILNAAFSYI